MAPRRATARSGPRPPLVLGLVGAGVAAATVLPIAHLVVRAAEADDGWALVVSPRVLRFVWATVRLGVTVTLAALVLGVGLAWLLDRTDIPARRVLAVAAVLPLVVPTYVGALALLAAFGPGGLAFELPGIIGFWGATAALTLSTFPYVLLPVRSALATADPALEEAAQALGDRRAAAFRRAVLPQVRSAASAGALLVFLYVLSDFGAVAIMRYDTLTRGIFLEYRSAFNRAPAAVLGVLLVVLTLVALAGARRARGRLVSRSAASTAGRARPVPLGPWRWPAFAAVTALVTAGIGLPVGVLAYWALRGASRADVDALLGAVGTSTALSVGAAGAAVAIAVPVAVLVVRHRSRFSRMIESLATAGYALPGLVVALALVFFASRYLSPLYQTFLIVVVAYVVRFFPEALGAVQSSLVRIDPVLEEAGRSLGRGRLDLAATVTLPLLRGGLVAGAALVFLTAMKELPATLLLLPAGSDTLATLVWTGAAEGRYAQAAPPALLVVAISALVLWPLDRVRDHRFRQ
ncbi:MAG: iron ABC transporter permease [Actinobacteria bacterium]|nr:iron ABC transporter permease [Actinomycetota bacterium]